MSVLLQIQEPNQIQPASSKKIDSKSVAGIDLGTTNSVIALFDEDKCAMLEDSKGRVLLPSAVAISKSGIQVGHDALQAAKKEGVVLFRSIKRLVGALHFEAKNTAHLLDSAASENGPVTFKTPAGSKSVVDISAQILLQLKQRFEQKLKRPLTHAVVTVPAHFDHVQRAQTRQACNQAGFEVLRLINEPTAAAIAAGLSSGSKERQYFAVFDLGGGTFDVTLLMQSENHFLVQATGGNNHLGGDDFDALIAQHICAQMGLSIDDACVAQDQLFSRAKHIKEQLSEKQNVQITMNHFKTQEKQAIECNQAWFENASAALLKAIKKTCLQTIFDAGAALEQIQDVVLVGGATRMPFLQKLVEEVFGKKPNINADPDTTVAKGAALYAHQIADKKDAFLLVDVLPLSLGLETMGGVVEKIIPRNSAIPSQFQKTFTTYADNQTKMRIHVVQGEREMVTDCRSLGEFLIDFPPKPSGVVKMEMVFEVDESGVLTVEANVLNGDAKKHSKSMQFSAQIDSEQARKMLDQAHGCADSDLQKKQLAQAVVSARQYVKDFEKMLAHYAHSFKKKEPAQLKMLNVLVAKLNAAIDQGDLKKISEHTASLKESSEVFAKKIMIEQLNTTHSTPLTKQKKDPKNA